MVDMIGDYMYGLAKELFPINRSLTGPGVRETLRIIQREIPELKIHEVPTGTKVFDWKVPQEWSVKNAYVIGPDGEKIIDFQKNNLHLVGYSTPVQMELPLGELQKYLHSLPDQYDAIPYVTSYYDANWGFCLTHRQREVLKEGVYKVFIDSELKDGSLSYGEVFWPGETQEQIFLSTCICHPSMANNEISGPVLSTALGRWLSSLEKRHCTYRMVFIPETIGSIAYLSQHLQEIVDHTIAGFNLTCVGDDRAYSYLPSRRGDTLADRVLLHALKHHAPEFKRYSFLDRGSDERQYCAPGIDLPLVVFSRSKFFEYPEYHTSLDNLDVISPAGLSGSFSLMTKVLRSLELNKNYKATVLGEPQLGRRGLYPNLSIKGNYEAVDRHVNLLAYADGSPLLEIAEKIGAPAWELGDTVEMLVTHGLLSLDGTP
jgi:aminopeptidase-like protein